MDQSIHGRATDRTGCTDLAGYIRLGHLRRVWRQSILEER
jgi:hypothetical protein